MEHNQGFLVPVICPGLSRKQRAFLGDMERVFKHVIESGKLQNDFNWAIVRRLYNAGRNRLNSIWKLKISCHFVLTLFCKFNCKDDLFIEKIVDIYHQVLRAYQTLNLCGNCMDQNDPKHYLLEDKKDCYFILRSVNEPLHDSYRYYNRNLYLQFTEYAVYEGDYLFLQFLVKYGLSYFRLYLVELLEGVRSELARLYRKYSFHKGFQEKAYEQAKTQFVESVLKLFEIAAIDKIFNIRKILLTLKYVYICFRRNMRNVSYKDYIKCLNLYVLTVPESVVSLKDVQEILNLIFAHDLTFRNEMLSIFKEHYPENPRFCSPRSLKYLCRCKVRDCLRNDSNPSLPSVLAEIRIPIELKKYLMFSED